jgi:hypothetical protein
MVLPVHRWDEGKALLASHGAASGGLSSSLPGALPRVPDDDAMQVGRPPGCVLDMQPGCVPRLGMQQLLGALPWGLYGLCPDS